MKIEHLGLWTSQLDLLRDFYVSHFECRAGPKYTNAKTGFSSYFLSFESGARLELMSRADVSGRHQAGSVQSGYAHFAVSLGSEQQVRDLTERLRHAGVQVCSEPRRTGDGYYESTIADPDGNLIELTV